MIPLALTQLATTALGVIGVLIMITGVIVTTVELGKPG
jgi:hypothetical protein